MTPEACVDQATTCLVKANADPAQKDRWIDEAVVWMQKSIEAGGAGRSDKQRGG